MSPRKRGGGSTHQPSPMTDEDVLPTVPAGPLGALYPPQVIPRVDATRFSCKVKVIQQAFYDAQGELVLPCNLVTVFPIGAYVKVDFKVGTLKRTDGQNPPMQTLAFCSWATKVQCVPVAEGGVADGEIFGTKHARSEELNEPNKRPKVT